MYQWVRKLTICFLLNTVVVLDVMAAEKTFNPTPNYKGEMFVAVNPGQWGCDMGSNAIIIWGPWQTEKVNLHQYKSVAIIFKKEKRDSIPLTVIVNGCDSPQISIEYGKPGNYIIQKPDWNRR